MAKVVRASAAVWLLALIVVALPSTPQAQNPFDGLTIFRYDTFGDEQLWTDVLKMHDAVENISPRTALQLGLKVDSEALPPDVVAGILSGALSLDDPTVTVALLKLNAVVGIVAHVEGNGNVQRLGITCALCHSTVDNSFTTGVGRRLDGWANRDLNVGAILQVSALDPGLKAEFIDWGPGKYDPRHHIFDGTALRILNEPSIAVMIPAAFGLQGVGFETYTGDGPISYWNAYVGISQMGGEGIFRDPRIGVNILQRPDRITRKLPALLAYQLSLLAPAAPPNEFDPAAAARGQAVFHGQADCARCHRPPTYTDVSTGPNSSVPVLHSAFEIGANPAYALRSATKQFRTTPLRGVWQHPPYFHDGRARTLLDVVNFYNTHFPNLNLSEQQKTDLVAFLKSL